VVDTLGDHTPPKRLPSGVKKRRQKMAYVSNVAVAPGARRQGVAAALLRDAEQVRKEMWNTRELLPCGAKNSAPKRGERQQHGGHARRVAAGRHGGVVEEG